MKGMIRSFRTTGVCVASASTSRASAHKNGRKTRGGKRSHHENTLHERGRGAAIRERRRREERRNTSANSSAFSSSSSSSPLPSPARRLQRLEVPGLVARITPNDVIKSTQKWEDLQTFLRNSIDARSSGFGTGISAVIMDGSEDANALYEASIQAKGLLKDYASIPLLLNGRPDIAAACECEGVTLAAKDLPTVAARKILSSDESKQQAAIVIREVSSAQMARKNAEEGASALMVDYSALETMDLSEMKSSQRGSASIPILVNLDGKGLEGLAETCEAFDGAVGDPGVLKEIGEKFLVSQDNSKFGKVFCNALLSVKEQEDRQKIDTSSFVETAPLRERGGEAGGSAEGLKEAIERGLTHLQQVVDLKAPKLIDGQDGNASLLISDALQALNEAILLVIVGEFNAGKSSVINALLKDDILPTGVVPTTNEVVLIKYGEKAEMKQQEDGTFLRMTPSEMLKQVTVVDTPGTNVVLERQQKLTEDFIPKADLVLFTLSADRPLTESETKFMTFIKQWSKKIVFVVNKKELLTKDEIQEVSDFVKANSSQILGVKEPPIYPVSAKLELQNKKEESGFESLQKAVTSATGGLGDAAKLKFTTALSLGQSLCNALKEQIKVKNAALEEEKAVVDSVSKQVKQFRREMQKDANVQYSNIRRSLDSVVSASEELTDTLLSLSNAKDITGYVVGSDKAKISPSAEILSNFESALRTQVMEHKGWLLENCNQQCSYYDDFLQEKVRSLSQLDNLTPLTQANQEPTSSPEAAVLDNQVMDKMNAEEALLSMSSEVLTDVYETSVTEAATSSFGTAGAAAVITLLATFVLNSFQEDLLALTFGGGVAYLSILSIPLQRAKVKYIISSKLQKYISSLIDALKEDLEIAMNETGEKIVSMTIPVEEMIRREKEELAVLEKEHAGLESMFQELEVKVSALEK